MDWDKLRIFQAVADAGSFTHAGESLKLSQSAISRQIGALEEQLGVMLFHRHARGLILTEQGELLYRTARDMAAKVNTAEALLRANQDKSVDELDQHRLIIFGEDARAPVQDVNWLLREGNPDQATRLVVLRVNNTYGIFRAVESGLGIASLPDYLARESTKIDMVLPDLNVRTTDVYFTYPEELRHSKRIAVFRDFLLRKVAETRF
jgi:DNA-binding transcriptional LysR family regulator